MSRRCLFLDRDGVVNRSPGEGRYVLRWEDLALMPGLVELLRTAGRAGMPSIIVTSQRGVSMGLMTRDALEGIHARLQAELRNHGVSFLDILACTHSECDRHWAKPAPGMILEASRRHDLDLPGSIMVGDADRDIAMGANAGVGTTIRLRGEKPIGIEADYTCDNLFEVNELLQKLLPRRE